MACRTQVPEVISTWYAAVLLKFTGMSGLMLACPLRVLSCRNTVRHSSPSSQFAM